MKTTYVAIITSITGFVVGFLFMIPYTTELEVKLENRAALVKQLQFDVDSSDAQKALFQEVVEIDNQIINQMDEKIEVCGAALADIANSNFSRLDGYIYRNDKLNAVINDLVNLRQARLQGR